MEDKMVPSYIGGQAVIEGIMMKNASTYAVAVRKYDKQIIVKKETDKIKQRKKWTKLPFIRGVFAFVDSMVLGMKSLTYSAGIFAEDEEEAEPSKFEKKLREIFKGRFEDVMLKITVAISIIMAVGIFMLLPVLLSNVLRGIIHSAKIMAMVEGFMRLGIFILYVALISNMEDIKRVFMYHGAEHKCINCLEYGKVLSVENVAGSSKHHKRCGTSFMLYVMVISIIFFMIIQVDTLWLRLVSRVLLIPVIAGVSYEILRVTGNKGNNKFFDILSKPGQWLQALTTREPQSDMIEVAIAAVDASFDWRKFLMTSFPERYPEDNFPKYEYELDEAGDVEEASQM